MLVLSRNRDSEIHIGTGIVVKVLSIRNQRVKLGIEAPDDVHNRDYDCGNSLGKAAGTRPGARNIPANQGVSCVVAWPF